MKLKKIVLLSLVAGFTLLNARVYANNSNLDELRYRYNISENTSDLFSIKREFGNILKSGDVSYSLSASKEVVEKLDNIGNELDNIHVPEDFVHPYNVFLESVKAYRKSATCIRNAAEIMLGYFDGSEKDVNQLIELSGEYAETANMYLDLSISLHSKYFDEQDLKPESENKRHGKEPERDKNSPEFDSNLSEKISI